MSDQEDYPNCEDAINALERLKIQAEDELQQSKENLNSVTFTAPFEKYHEDSSLNDAFQSLAQTEDKIETLRMGKSCLLPKDENLFLSLANEESQLCLIHNQKIVAHLKKQIEQLKKEKKAWSYMVHESDTLNEELDKILETRSEDYFLTNLKQKYAANGEIFRELKTELHWILEKHFPSTDEENGASMHDLIETLTRKLLEDPANPYADVTEREAPLDHVKYLMKFGLVVPHPNDYNKIRLADVRY